VAIQDTNALLSSSREQLADCGFAAAGLSDEQHRLVLGNAAPY
jgi:hypothetical protein